MMKIVLFINTKYLNITLLYDNTCGCKYLLKEF